VDLIRLVDLPRLILQPSVASTKIFYDFSTRAPFCFLTMMLSQRTFQHLCQIKICRQPLTHSLSRNHPANVFGGNPFVDGILGHSLLLFQAFLVGIPSWVGFSRPQLVVVSGLFRWESLSGWDFLGHNLLLSQASFFTMEFRLSQSLSRTFFSFFHDGTPAITKPFSRTFFFHDGILAITKPFSRTFFFHDGILAITKPFSRSFFFHDGILSHPIFRRKPNASHMCARITISHI
jgi:hypothetical protein